MTALLDEVRESLSLPGPQEARRIREDAGVSRARLAAELGAAELTVMRWEQGAHAPRGELRLAYIRLLRELQDAIQEGGSAA
jgi:DNA-binding transcriptional regulator YiaG